MKKILKYKSIIILLLVFTISFNIVTDYKQKEVQAVALIDDAILWTLGLLVLSTGVVALNSEQIIDMGSMVYDKLSLDEEEYKNALQIGEYSQEEQYRIKVTDKLKEIVNQVAESLPSVDKFLNSEKVVEGELSFSYGSIPFIQHGEKIFLCSGVINKDGTLTVNSSNGYSTFENVYKNDLVEVYIRGHQGATVLYNYIAIQITRNNNVVTYGSVYNSWEEAINETVSFTLTDLFDTCLVADSLECIPYSQPVIKEGYNPTYTNDRLKENTYIPIPRTVPTDTAISTDMPLDWEQAKAKGLVTDIPIDQAREKTGDFTGDITGEKEGNLVGDITGSAEKGFTLRFPNILNLLKQLLIYLFKPTLALENIFPFPTDTGLGDLINLYDYSAIWSITPKPIEFKTTINKEGVGNANISRLWNVEFKPFEIPFIANNLNTIRNVFSYSLLLSVIYAIVHHLLPKREMD